MIDMLFTAYEWEVQANYIFLAVTTVIIGRSMFVGSFTGAVKDKAYGYLQGFGYALTILVAFQWVIAFTGGITFVLRPYESIGDSIGFVAALSLVHIAAALMIRRYGHVVFRQDMSKQLLLIDISAKLFFIAFFNLFFPKFFEVLGMENYSILALVLLTTAVIFAVYREYSVSLEKQIAVHNSNLLTVTQWALGTIEKYEHFIGYGDEDSAGFLKAINSIQPIKNPILKALLYELVFLGERLGISVDISISPTSSGYESSEDINLNNYDLYVIINDFVGNAITEAKSQTQKSICVEIVHHDIHSDKDTMRGFSFNIQTYLGQAHVQDSDNAANSSFVMTSSDFKVKKDAIISQMRKNRNITISLTKTDRFEQVLSVGV